MARTAGPAGRDPPPTVVLIEDHDGVRLGVTHLLITAGFDVVATASTLRDGYTAVVTHRPDITVIDDLLPDGAGIDLCRTLATELPDLPCIIYATIVTRADERQARDAGAAAILEKTLNGQALVDSITVHAAQTPRPAVVPRGSDHPTR